jgi:RHS repeat-associated protein
MCEARDATGNLISQFFMQGQTIATNNYFYTKDHLGSIRELTDSSGNFQAVYNYDSSGRTTKIQGNLTSDFDYAGYYKHASSGLDLTVYRAYSSDLNRWLSRDLLGESAGNNLYAYALNNPISSNDPLGLAPGGTIATPHGEYFLPYIPQNEGTKYIYRKHVITYPPNLDPNLPLGKERKSKFSQVAYGQLNKIIKLGLTNPDSCPEYNSENNTWSVESSGLFVFPKGMNPNNPATPKLPLGSDKYGYPSYAVRITYYMSPNGPIINNAFPVTGVPLW